MNYIKEINAFIDWLEINPLEATTQALWFHLMAICNKSGWPDTFTVANLTLQAKLGVTDKTLNKHRNVLIQKGRIEYKSQGKQKAGRYRIIPFQAQEGREGRTEQAADNNAFDFYQRNIGPINGFIDQHIGAWIDDLNDEMVQAAMKIAVYKNARNWSYIESILKDWANKGFKSVEDVKREHEQFKAKKQSQKNQSVKKDKLPKWIEDQQPPLKQNDPVNEEEKRERMESLLKALGEWEE